MQRIFQYLDFATIVRCLHVSKDWRQYLTSRGNERLWRSLLYTKQFPHRYAPSTASLKKLISYSGNDVRHIVIDSVLRFRLTQQKLNTLLQGSKNLESLVLRGNIEEDLEIPMAKGFFQKLNRIFLDELSARKPHILEPLLTQASESIRNLHIRGLPLAGAPTTLEFPSLPNLQYLRIEEQNKPSPTRLAIVSCPMAVTMPWLTIHSGPSQPSHHAFSNSGSAMCNYQGTSPKTPNWTNSGQISMPL